MEMFDNDALTVLKELKKCHSHKIKESFNFFRKSAKTAKALYQGTFVV